MSRTSNTPNAGNVSQPFVLAGGSFSHHTQGNKSPRLGLSTEGTRSPGRLQAAPAEDQLCWEAYKGKARREFVGQSATFETWEMQMPTSQDEGSGWIKETLPRTSKVYTSREAASSPSVPVHVAPACPSPPPKHLTHPQLPAPPRQSPSLPPLRAHGSPPGPPSWLVASGSARLLC